MCQGVFGIVDRVVISRYIIQRYVQKCQEIFQVGIGQVSTAQNEFYFVKVSTCTKTIKALDDFIANDKDFHSPCIVP